MAATYHFIRNFDFIGRSKSGTIVWVKSYKAGTTVRVPDAQIATIEKSGSARRVDAGQSASRATKEPGPV